MLKTFFYRNMILDPYARAYGSRFYHSTIGTPDDADYQPSFGGAMTPPPRTPATPGNRSLASGRFGASVGPARVPISRLRKDSVARMSWKVLSAVVKGQGVMNNLIVSQHHMAGQADKRSFQRTSLDEGDETCHEADASFFTQEMPTIVEGESLQDEVFFDHVTAEDARRTPTLKQVQGRKRGQKIGVERVLSTALHREKREFGRGLVGALLNRRLRRQRLDSNVKRQIDTFDNHRPYFTYWITFVHIVITIISIVVYGVAPVGFTYVEEKFTTMKYSRSRVRETFREPQNFWIGPRTKDLIRLGAKYSPCMRLDRKLGEWIAKERNIERNSSCCVRSDNSGCIQTADKCGPWFNEFNKWDGRNQDAAKFNSTRLRTSGSVCGQDPRFCGSQQDAAGTPNEWPDDITKWPICKNPINDTAVDHRDGSFPHMRCTIVGHPCCIGQEASCQIVAEEYCKKKHGIYHPDAFLCSQVNCMQDTCGLIPFRDPERPDQLYRLWLPILLHAGVLHCLVSVLFQMTVVRDMEKLAGWLRISIIYMLSGVAGNLGSAIFLPYRAEVGPAGSHFGILACLFVEVFQTWQLLRSPSRALFKLVTIAVVLFLIGCLPWIDNFAHIFGFLSGFLLSFVFLPYITFNRFDARRKRIQVFTCFFMFVGLFALLVFFFYISPITDCEPCKYLNCAFAENFCSNHGFKPGDRGD